MKLEVVSLTAELVLGPLSEVQLQQSLLPVINGLINYLLNATLGNNWIGQLCETIMILARL